VGPGNIEIFFGQFWVGLGVQKYMAKNNVAAVLNGGGERGILIAGELQFLNLFAQRGRRRSTNLRL